MHHKKVISLILCIVMIAMLVTSCIGKIDSAYLDTGEGPLMIYLWQFDEYMKHHIDVYNSLHDETQIEYKAFSYLKTMCYKIEKGIEEGDGPDLILIDSILLKYADICKMIEDGMFTDLDNLIKHSQHFDEGKYNMQVLDTGIIDETRVFIPVSYKLNVASALVKNFEKIGIEVPSELTSDTLNEILNKYYEITPKNSLPMLGVDLEKSLFLCMNKEKRIDKIHEFEQLINIYDEVYNRRTTSDLYSASAGSGFDIYDWCFENNVLFTRVSSGCDAFFGLYYLYNVFKNEHDSDMVIYNYPLTAEKTKSNPNLSLAISATADKKNKAFKFIEYMLSKEAQSGDVSPGIPVNLEAYALSKEKFLNGDYGYIGKDISTTPVPAELAFQYISIIDNAECEFNNNDYVYYNCFKRPVGMYMGGNMLVQEIVDDINENLYKYYNEEEEE